VPVPRRAGISAIGAGGTSAHIVLEQYEMLAAQAAQAVDRLFPLSARTEEQLKQAALRLRDFLRADASAHEDDIAHTLQIGRRCFDHRLTVIAKTREELIDRLTAFLDGRRHDDVMQGHVKDAEAITGFLNAREKQDFVGLIVQSRDVRRLGKLWSQGVIAHWQGLDIGQAGRKTPLPTYPFADERYWITDRALPQAAAVSIEPAVRTVSTAPVAGRQVEVYQFSQGTTPGDAITGLSIDDKARLFVRQIFANELRVPAHELDDACQIMDTGVSSLDMAGMTRHIKERIDPSFSPIAFFECTTLRALADWLARKYAAPFEAMHVSRSLAIAEGYQAAEPRKAAAVGDQPLHLEDAAAELVLPDLGCLPRDDTALRTVLLTGATGFLGIHVLAEWLASDPQATAYCLVRANSREHALERILQQAKAFELDIDAERIRPLCGDINLPALGLSTEDWTLCGLDAQQIIHASAHVNHIEGYATFRESTNAMKEVIRLAGTGRLKLVQFISSTAGCALKIGDEFSIFEKEDFIQQGQHVYGGYGQSKWVQETFLQRAHAAGLPYVIYRFGELCASSRTGLGQTDDMLHRLLQMRLAVGCREKISSDVLDMLPVDFAARLIVGTGRAPTLWNGIVHATHLKPYSFANLYRKAQGQGLSFDPVTRSQYLARCHEFVKFIDALDPVNGFVLECVLRDAEGSIRHRKMMDGYFSVIFPFQQDGFRRALATLGLTLPDWNALFDRCFEVWNREDCGFMARIHEFRRLGSPQPATGSELIVIPAPGVSAPAADRRGAKGKKNSRNALMLENANEG
jgi:thioester reductase-like protein